MVTRHVRYHLASTANYRFGITKMGQNQYDPVAFHHKVDFPDVEVTRPGVDTDLQKVYDTCLLTVNGYVHSSAFFDGRLYIPKATPSMLRSRSNVTGMLDFSKLTTFLQRTPITAQMVTQEDNVPAYDRLIVTFETPVVQPLLVLAGYIIPYDPEFFYRISDSAFVVCLSRMHYMERLYELSRYTDIFKALEVPVSPLNPQMVDTEVVRSFAVLRRLLSLHNSFMVDLGERGLEYKRVYLDHSRIPGTHQTQVPPTMPLVSGYGKLSEYAVRKNGPKGYTVTSQDVHFNNHLFSHMPAAKCKVYNDHRLPGQTHGLSQSHFLDIFAPA